MLVTIVITNFNYGAYLRAAIDSALNQRYPSIEIIVVDDGSTDNSREIIASYGQQIVAILKDNGGQNSCFNIALKRSKGDVIVFLDADDVLFDNAVELHVERFRDPSVVKSNGYLEVTDDALRPIGAMIPSRLAPSGNYRERLLQIGPAAYRSSFTSGNAWSRDFLEKVMPLPLDGSLGSDGFLTAVDLLFGRIESIPLPIGQYRLHDSNKGPLSPTYGIEYLRKFVHRYERRMDYAAMWAEKLGYTPDRTQWVTNMGWRRALAHQALYLSGDKNESIPSTRLILAPLRSENSSFQRKAYLTISLSLTKMLPRSLALPLAHSLLRKSFQKLHTRSGIGRHRATLT
jgi:glycosyltransferase involved in cell wall biosynthesis